MIANVYGERLPDMKWVLAIGKENTCYHHQQVNINEYGSLVKDSARDGIVTLVIKPSLLLMTLWLLILVAEWIGSSCT